MARTPSLVGLPRIVRRSGNVTGQDAGRFSKPGARFRTARAAARWRKRARQPGNDLWFAARSDLEELSEDVLQDAAVLDVLELDRCIDARPHLERLLLAVVGK